MFSRINKFLDILSEYLAHRKGLLPIIGILLVFINFVLQFLSVDGWVIQSNFFMDASIETFSDNGAGVLTGNGTPAGTGTIDYDTVLINGGPYYDRLEIDKNLVIKSIIY